MSKHKQKEMLRVAGELLQSGREMARRAREDNIRDRDLQTDADEDVMTTEYAERGFE